MRVCRQASRSKASAASHSDAACAASSCAAAAKPSNSSAPNSTSGDAGKRDIVIGEERHREQKERGLRKRGDFESWERCTRKMRGGEEGGLCGLAGGRSLFKPIDVTLQ